MSFAQQRYEGDWVSAAVYTWTLTHWNQQEMVSRKGAMATYHEITVCLAGQYEHTALDERTILAGEKSIVAYNRGELFDFSYGGALGPGKLVGFGMPSAEALGVADFEFKSTAIEDEEFIAFVTRWHQARENGNPLPVEELHAALRAFVLKHGTPVKADAILNVKNEIDRNPAAPLYLAHLAEMANMKPDTFSRAFARRFGLSPIAYRVRRRLLEAGRLLIESPEMLVSEIAARVGFDDVRNFHRAFRQRAGVSPLEFRMMCGVTPRARRGSGAPPKSTESIVPATEQVA